MPPEETLATKLGELPLVEDAWSAALGYYTWVKDYNVLTRLTLNVAESSLKKAVDISSPVVSRYQPQISSVNAVACSKLEELEEMYPILKQPTAEVKEACAGYVQPMVDTVSPYVGYVSGVVDNTRSRVNQIKASGANVVTGVRDLGVNTINQVLVLTLRTPPGRLMTRTMDYALVQTDCLIDRYMPEVTDGANATGNDDAVDDHDDDSGDKEDDGGNNRQCPKKDNVDDGDGDDDGDDDDDNDDGDDDEDEDSTNPKSLEEASQKDEADPSLARVAARMRTVGIKLRHRLHQRAFGDFQQAKKRTVAAVSQLQQTLTLVDLAKIDFKGALSKAQEVWAEINKSDVPSTDTDKDDNLSGTYAEELERKIIMMGRTITGHIRGGVTALEKAAAEAGLFVKDPLSKSREYRDLIQHFSAENISNAMGKVRENVALLQKKLKNMLSKLESPDWLSKRLGESPDETE